jgi:hypothetical protein
MGNGDQETIMCLSLEDFSSDCKELELDAFTRRHGESFLLHHGPFDRLKQPMASQATMTLENGDTKSDRPFNPQADFLVFPVNKPQSDGTRADMVWLGRSDFNEVVVPDATISEVQAFIRKADDGGYFIQDAGSRNGTFVNDDQVPAQGMGSAVLLNSGARLRLGQVKLIFLNAEQLYVLLNRLLA